MQCGIEGYYALIFAIVNEIDNADIAFARLEINLGEFGHKMEFDYYKVLEMRQEGLTSSEIASMLGIKKVTLYCKMSRARKKIN